MSGKIDRIDLYKSQIMIIDYKSSLREMKTAQYWSKNKIEVQMPLYIQAVEAGLLNELDDHSYNIAGALYLSYKNFELKGMVLDHSEWSRFLKKGTSIIDSDKKEVILKKVNTALQIYLKNIQKGIFHPQPIIKSECEKCHWSQICRAPHLR